jgi:hypothetical protein
MNLIALRASANAGHPAAVGILRALLPALPLRDVARSLYVVRAYAPGPEPIPPGRASVEDVRSATVAIRDAVAAGWEIDRAAADRLAVMLGVSS